MNIIDWVFVGRVLEKSDVIVEVPVWAFNRRRWSLLVARRWGKNRLALKEVETSLGVPMGVQYSFISPASLPELKQSYPNIEQWLNEV